MQENNQNLGPAESPEEQSSSTAQTVSPPPTATNPSNPSAGPYREDPGQTFGIIGLILNIMGILPGGIVLGILSRNKSREAGVPTTLGTIAMVWGIIGTVLGILAFLAWLAIMVFVFAASPEINESAPLDVNEGSYSDSSSISYSQQKNTAAKVYLQYFLGCVLVIEGIRRVFLRPCVCVALRVPLLQFGESAHGLQQTPDPLLQACGFFRFQDQNAS